jgi:GT2 family glycosyltransferase
MRITALLAAHNRRTKTLACLSSYFAQEVPGDVVLSAVLVDDGSSDGTADAVRARFPEVEVIEESGNLFWATAMAVAEERARQSVPDFVIWLNDDVTLDQGALRIMLLAAQSTHSSGCIVVGAVRDPVSGQLTYSGVRRSQHHPLRTKQVPPAEERPLEVDTFNGNVVLVSREAWQRVGPIDGRFAHAAADHDYGLRARDAGIPVLLAPGMVGACPGNPEPEPWTNPSLTVRERFAVLVSRKGHPPRERARFLRRHGGPLWPIFWLSPYVRAVPSVLRGRRPGRPRPTTAQRR